MNEKKGGSEGREKVKEGSGGRMKDEGRRKEGRKKEERKKEGRKEGRKEGKNSCLPSFTFLPSFLSFPLEISRWRAGWAHTSS